MAQGECSTDLQTGKVSDKDDAEVTSSTTRGQPSMPEPPGGSLLDYVLNEKKLELLKSPEVIQFLQGHQAKQRRHKLHSVNKSGQCSHPRGQDGLRASLGRGRVYSLVPQRAAVAGASRGRLPLAPGPRPSSDTALPGPSDPQQYGSGGAPPVKVARLDLQDCVRTVMANSGPAIGGVVGQGAEPGDSDRLLPADRAPAARSSIVASAPRLAPVVCVGSLQHRARPTTNTKPDTQTIDTPLAPVARDSQSVAATEPGIWSGGASAFTTVTPANVPRH